MCGVTMAAVLLSIGLTFVAAPTAFAGAEAMRPEAAPVVGAPRAHGTMSLEAVGEWVVRRAVLQASPQLEKLGPGGGPTVVDLQVSIELIPRPGPRPEPEPFPREHDVTGIDFCYQLCFGSGGHGEEYECYVDCAVPGGSGPAPRRRGCEAIRADFENARTPQEQMRYLQELIDTGCLKPDRAHITIDW